MMTVALMARAWLELLYVDLVSLKGFRAMHRLIVATPTRPPSNAMASIGAVDEAFGTAATLYIRPVACLHRSAVVTRLLRREGIPAELVIGSHLAPLRAHAWVEVSGKIVSDNRSGLEHYSILDRW